MGEGQCMEAYPNKVSLPKNDYWLLHRTLQENFATLKSFSFQTSRVRETLRQVALWVNLFRNPLVNDESNTPVNKDEEIFSREGSHYKKFASSMITWYIYCCVPSYFVESCALRLFLSPPFSLQIFCHETGFFTFHSHSAFLLSAGRLQTTSHPLQSVTFVS